MKFHILLLTTLYSLVVAAVVTVFRARQMVAVVVLAVFVARSRVRVVVEV
jgi:hypothetical protein